MKKEVWKDIIDYEGYYQISNLGRVKFLERIIINKGEKKPRILKEKICTQWISKRGYYVTDLRVNKQRKTCTIHRLVAIHFIDNPYNLKHVNHIDGNPLNNDIPNLEWVTNRENVCHAKKRANSTSKYIGVGWDKHSNKWKAQIYHKGKSVHLGNFSSEEKAYEARLKYEEENNIKNKYI